MLVKPALRPRRGLLRRTLVTTSLGLFVTFLLGVAGCLRFSPYEIDLDDSRKGRTIQRLQRIDAQPQVPGETFSFGFMADTHDGYDDSQTIMDQMAARGDLRFILHAGDFTDFGSEQEFKWFDDILEKQSLPVIVATGNHDGLTQGKELYKEMFGAPNFTFTYSGVKFVFFNTNTIEYGLSAPDLAWLDKETDRTGDRDTRGVVVVTHHPPDSTPHLTAEVQKEYRAIHEKNKVLVNLHGHVHQDYLIDQKETTWWVRTKAALLQSYMIVTTDGVSLSIQRCNITQCGVVQVLTP